MTDLNEKLSMLNTIGFLRSKILKTKQESETAKDINIYEYAYLKGKISAYNEAAEMAEINMARAETIQ